MRNFSVYNPTRLHFGSGQLSRLSEEIPPGSRVLALHGGAGILQSGLWDEVQRSLPDVSLSRFGAVEANPQYDTLLRAVSQASKERCDFILSIGGDALIHAGKFLAAALCHPGDPLQLLCGAPIRAALPLGCVLSLPLGSALGNTQGLVSHAERQQKLPFASPLLHPRFAILDTRPHLDWPARQLAQATVEAFDHALSHYLPATPADPLQARYAESLLLTLIETGPAAQANPDAEDARASLLWCVLQTRQGPLGYGMPRDRSARLIGQQLGALYHLTAAQSLALILPALLGEYREIRRDRLLQYAERVWQLRDGSATQRMDDAIAATAELFGRLGLATRLSEHGLDAEVVPEVLAQLQRHGLVAAGEQSELDLDLCERVLLRAL